MVQSTQATTASSTRRRAARSRRNPERPYDRRTLSALKLRELVQLVLEGEDPEAARELAHRVIAASRGRPRKFTAELEARAREMLRAGRTRSNVCRELGVARRTLDRRMPPSKETEMTRRLLSPLSTEPRGVRPMRRLQEVSVSLSAMVTDLPTRGRAADTGACAQCQLPMKRPGLPAATGRRRHRSPWERRRFCERSGESANRAGRRDDRGVPEFGTMQDGWRW
jgi:hypothetical protein